MGNNVAMDSLVARARARCAQHRGPTSGFCHLCFRTELEDHLARENPTMSRDEAVQLVDDWILAADHPEN
ncbi:MAG: hypothetical protein WEF50_10640 [Myxococcota bacterium]